MRSIAKGVYIVSADAKDLFLANYSNEGCTGYSVHSEKSRNRYGLNTRRFINTLDYSLDLIKLEELYERVYRRSDFRERIRGKDYCRCVINVTFKYSVKEYNRFPASAGSGGVQGRHDTGLYMKLGYLPQDVEMHDCVCVVDGELAGIQLGIPVEQPVSAEILGDYFALEDGVYVLQKAIPTVHTVSWLREYLYQHGFVCDGVKFKRFKRSSGSSRVGKCLFIDDNLYARMLKWGLCGLKVEQGQEIDLAALEAYIALTLSSITGTLHLEPKNFLVIDDYGSVFDDRVVATRVGEDGWLTAQAEDVTIENSIWDGQSLIDRSLMEEYGCYGMVLLRNRFFKSACFNTNIQQFFEEHGITSVEQLRGRTQAERIEDIRVITTPSSIKYLKFGSLEQWLAELEADGEFGVVKHEKPTHFFDGRMVQIHYQLLNTLQMTQEEVDALVQPSLDYLRKIQTDPAVLRHYIRYAGTGEEVKPASTTNDVVYQMLGITDRFADTKLCRDFVTDLAKSFKRTLRRGHILVNGNYSTLLGNPMEMLMASIGEFDGESRLGIGNIHSVRFPEGTVLGSRSPHVTMGNVWLAENVQSEEIDRYFNLTNEIVCINSIGENTLMRLSGCDFDSDSVLLTDNALLIAAARKNYDNFLVPTSFVDAKKVVRHYTTEDQADLDIKTSVNKIGEIVNLSQELNTKLWDQVNNGASIQDVEEIYYDIAKLDVLSGIEIDKAKKEFTVNSGAEIKRLKKKYAEADEDGRQVKPNFLGKIARMKGYYDSKTKNYKMHKTTMDYLQRSINVYRSGYTKKQMIPFAQMLNPEMEYSSRRVRYSQIDRILDLVRDMRGQIQAVWSNTHDGLDNASKAQIVQDIRSECGEHIASMRLGRDTAIRLLMALDDPSNRDIARNLFFLLFSLPNQSFLELLDQSRQPAYILQECEADGDVEIYQFQYQKTLLPEANGPASELDASA